MTVAINVVTPLAIYDYDTLLSEAQLHLDRDDLTSQFPRFIQLVEHYMKRKLRTLDMETSATLAATSAVVQLPDNVLSIRSLTVSGDWPRSLVTGAPSAVPMSFNGRTGVSTAYTRIGNTLELADPPIDGEGVSLRLIYTAQFVPLVQYGPTNWIIDRHADVYFYGVLAQAYAYIEDPANAQAYSALFDSVLDDLSTSRASDAWGSGATVPTSVRQVRGARC